MLYQSFYGIQGNLQSNILDHRLEIESATSTWANGAGYLKQFMLPDDPTVEMSFGRTHKDIEPVVIEIECLSPGDPFKIHVRELEQF